MPLKVVVVGAGLAGLGAAIALNRSGHEVQVIEQSSFLNEVGAAIHVAPNATRILREWGCDFEKLQPVHCTKVQLWTSAGDLISTPVVTKDVQERLGITDDFLLTHRVDLHNTLRDTAAKGVGGRRVDIRLSSRVVSVDAEAGQVTLEDGTVYTGDLIIGADGIHSRSVRCITGGEERKDDTGQNYGVHGFIVEDRRLVFYPCRRGDLINAAGIHPSGLETAAKDSSWLDSASRDALLDTFESFSPELREMCRIAEDVKVWSLKSRKPPRTFVKGKLALAGDAAHPTLPHQGQGGAQSFEDAAALGALFTSEMTPEQVPERLQLYNQVRYGHSVTVMMMSKVPDNRRAEMLDELRLYVPAAEVPEDMFSFTWNSYPVQEAQRALTSDFRV
ncbi:FAD/NAD(P)-binding domain-containing protein [Penicillium atrosanguineum]|uniref:FAD/NAD(P)-binding domain-containing protein n=1 Tax=Penicillium atrosanguineum TaxID=1132637 RepID=A0A9W9PQQ8_9EURO|nr:FAD/NAD(P)-binding domain-containing protein [Penicillium atrosanguineum]